MTNVQTAQELGGNVQAELLSYVPSWHKEVQSYLPTFPDEVTIGFDNQYIMSDTGTGGAAASKDKVVLSFDPAFPGDRTEQIESLRATYFHESFHIVQGYVLDNADLKGITAIEHAVYEGAATKFDMLRAGSNHLIGHYPNRQTILEWFNEVKLLGSNFDYSKYKFYDPETDRHWIIYRVGTFIIDEALRHNPQLAIEDIATKPPTHILELARLAQ